LTRAEQEVQSAAERLNSQTEAALAAVAARQTPGGVDELDASADRLERAARDLSVALRELVEERREKDKQPRAWPGVLSDRTGAPPHASTRRRAPVVRSARVCSRGQQRRGLNGK
jgi:hypothetical protein